MFVLLSKHKRIVNELVETRSDWADYQRRTNDKFKDARAENLLLRDQIDRQAKYIEELKRRNSDGTFKAEGDFLTR